MAWAALKEKKATWQQQKQQNLPGNSRKIDSVMDN